MNVTDLQNIQKESVEHFVAVLKAKHSFDGEGDVTIACKVQDNLAGEAIVSRKMTLEA